MLRLFGIFLVFFVSHLIAASDSIAKWSKTPKTLKSFGIEECSGDLMSDKTTLGVLRYSKEGSFTIYPEMAIDPNNNAWINDIYNRRIYALDSNGKIVRVVNIAVAPDVWNIRLSGITKSRLLLYANDQLYLYSFEGELKKTIKVDDSPGNIRVRPNGFIACIGKEMKLNRFDEIGNLVTEEQALGLTGELKKKTDGSYVVFDNQEFKINIENTGTEYNYFFGFVHNSVGLFAIGEDRVDQYTFSGEKDATFNKPLNRCSSFKVEGSIPVDFMECSDIYSNAVLANNNSVYLSHLNINAKSFRIIVYEKLR